MRKIARIRYLIGIIGVFAMPLTTSANEYLVHTVAKIQNKIITCDNPRPIICQQNSAPVCGILIKTKTVQTFRNACLACSNPDVKGYELGKCKNN